MQNPFDVKKLLVEAMTGSRIPNPTLNNIKNCLVRIYKDNPAYAVRDEDAVVLKEFNYYDRTIVSIVDGIDFVGDVAGWHCFVEELPYKQNGFLIFGGEIWRAFTNRDIFISNSPDFAKYKIPDQFIMGDLVDSLDLITDLFSEEKIFGIKTSVLYACALVSAMKQVSKLDSVPFSLTDLAKYYLLQNYGNYSDESSIKNAEKFVDIVLDSFENDGEPMNKLAILAEYNNTHKI